MVQELDSTGELVRLVRIFVLLVVLDAVIHISALVMKKDIPKYLLVKDMFYIGLSISIIIEHVSLEKPRHLLTMENCFYFIGGNQLMGPTFYTKSKRCEKSIDQLDIPS